MLIAPGFGDRGILKEKILAKFARKIKFTFGHLFRNADYDHQFARNVLGLKKMPILQNLIND